MKWLVRHAPDDVFAEPPRCYRRVPSKERDGPWGAKTTNVFQGVADELTEGSRWWKGAAFSLKFGSGDSDHLVNEPLPVPIDRIRTPDEAWTGQQSHAQPTQELAPTGGKLTEAVVSFCFCYRALQSFP